MQERVRIPAANGSLAGELIYPFDETRYTALIVNPHPHMGGRTGNNLLVRIAESLAGDGGVVLMFDYSGVGESDGPRIDVSESMSQFWRTGVAPEDPRMVDETRSALSWLARLARGPLLVLGYSFGAYAATCSITDEVRGCMLISPTITHHDFSALRRHSIPKLVIHSDDDFATPAKDTSIWLACLSQPIETVRLPRGDHFFRGHEDAVARACVAFANGIVGKAPA